MKILKRNEDAFTGLEAAIVLIAFVVVAAVFSYVVLGAGFFTTQKSQQVVHAGVTQAASNIVVKGNVYGLVNPWAGTGPDHLDEVQFDIGLAAGGLPVDINQLEIVMSTPNSTPQLLQQIPDGDQFPGMPGVWDIYQKTNANADDLLDPGELFTILVVPPVNVSLDSRTTFDIELKPATGASLGIERTIPPGITNTTLLY